MTDRLLSVRSAIAAAALGLASAGAAAVTLYDAGAGTLPPAQGWSPLAAGSAPAQQVTGNRYLLDTSGPGVSIFGNGLVSVTPLDTVAGFTLAFNLQIGNETHSSANRGGYSVLVVGADATQALEIAFWGGNVWVYDYDAANADRFVHGPDAAFNTAPAHNYTLAVRNNQFTLAADGNPLLAGALRNYSAGGPPYTQPNFIFFGDDSARGTSASGLALVTLSPVPEPAAGTLLLAGIACLAWRLRAVAQLPSATP